jgi:hypothetical protein
MQLGDCPHLPEELNVFCETCRFNFFTTKGNPPGEEPLDCAHAGEPLARVETCARVGGDALLILGRRSRDPSGW